MKWLYQSRSSCSYNQEKLIIESLRYRKTTQRYFCFQTALNLCISFSFQFNSRREVFLENIVPENMFSFPDAFFSLQYLRKTFVEFFTAIVLLLSATFLKVKVLNRLASNRNNTQQRCQSFSSSHRNFFLKVAGARRLCWCLKNICEVFKNIMLG